MTDADPGLASASDDSSDPSAAPPNDAQPNDVSSEAKPPKKRRRWGRWLLILVVIGVIARIALGFALPSILDAALASKGWRADYEAIDLSILGADLELWHFELRDRETNALYLHTEYCRADVAVLQLFRGRLDVRRVESDGVDIHLERRADGSLPILAGFTGEPATETEPRPQAEAENATTEPLDLEPPLVVHAVRFQHAYVHVLDRTVSPAFSRRVLTHLRLSDIGHVRRPTRLEVEVEIPGVIDRIRIEGSARSERDKLRATISLAVNGVEPQGLAPYVPALEDRPNAESWSFGGTVDLSLVRPEPGAPFDLVARCLDLDATAGQWGRAHLALATLTGAVDLDQFRFDTLAVEQGWIGAELPAPTRENPKPTETTTLAFQLDDATAERKSESDDPNSRWLLDTTFQLPGIAGTGSGGGVITVGADSAEGELQLELESFLPTALSGWLSALGVTVDGEPSHVAGSLGFEASRAETAWTADAALHSMTVETLGGPSWIEMPRLAIDNVRIATDGSGISVDRVALTGPSIRVERQTDGRFAWGPFHYAPSTARPAAAEAETPDATPTPPTDVADSTAAGSAASESEEPESRSVFELAAFEWTDIRATFVDRSIDPEGHVVELSKAGLSVHHLVWPVPPSHTVVTTFDAQLPGLIESVEFDGAVETPFASSPSSSSDDGVDPLPGWSFEGRFDLVGLQTETLRPYLDQAKLDWPPLRGSLRSKLRALFTPSTQRASVRIMDAEITDDRPLAEGGEAESLVRLDALEFLATLAPTTEVTLAATGSTLGVPSWNLKASATESTATTPSSWAAALELSAPEINGPALAPRLPTGIRSTVEDGHLSVALSAEVRPNAEGGLALRASVDEASFGGAPSGGVAVQPFAVKSVTLEASRLDAVAGIYQIDALSVAGLTGSVEKRTDGAIAAAGWVIGAPTASPVDHGSATDGSPSGSAGNGDLPQANAGTGNAAPGAGSPATGPGNASASPTTDVAALPAPVDDLEEEETSLPTVRLDQLDLDLAGFTFHDRSLGGEPITVRGRMTNGNPWALLDDDLEALAPLELRWIGTVEPLIETVELTTVISPFAAQPEVNVEFTSTGWNGSALARVAPAIIAPQENQPPLIDASALDGGSLRAKLWGGLELTRSGPLEIDFRRAIRADARVSEVVLENGALEPVLGVRAIDITELRWEPRVPQLSIGTIEVETPLARVHRYSDGVGIAGVRLRSLPSEEPAGTTPTSTPAPPSTPTAPPKNGTATPPALPISVATTRVTGLDVTLTDHTLEPTWSIGLDDLDLEVRGVTTRRPAPRPLSWTLRVAGARGPQPDQRLFGELAVDGELQLGPSLSGQVQAQLGAFSLAGVRAPVAQYGVSLDGGMVDLDLSARLTADGAVETDGRTVLTDLDVEEGKDGPIRRYLNLPTPLQVAVFLVRDADGSITLPLDFQVPGDGGVSVGAVALAASRAIGLVVADAIASSPFRLTGTLTDLTGLTGGEPDPVGDPVRTTIQAGATQVPLPADGLSRLIDELASEDKIAIRLEHSTGRGDWEIAKLRANPPRDECLAIAAELRSRRTELRAERRALLADASQAILNRLPARAAEARARLRENATEAGKIERALDRWLTLATERSPYRAERRTRTAAIAIAERRLAHWAQLLEEAGVARDRIRIVRPRFSPDEPTPTGDATLVASPYRR